MTAEEHAGFWTDVRWDGPFAPLDIRGDALDNHLHGYGTYALGSAFGIMRDSDRSSSLGNAQER